jgi:exosome complex exonuclease RRP6
MKNLMRNQNSGYLGKQYGSPNQRFAILENKNIPRPQDNFINKIDNSYRPFEPIIKEKPNASIPLNLNVEYDEHGNEYYAHPYEYEILQFQVDSSLLVYREPIMPPDLDSTPIIKVETIQELEAMCQHIEEQTEFAVDVEHHSYRSYQGLTCLVQISTRTQDFVIDAIKLRDELHRLNRSFTNPNIVKVFHGADCDILWLQRDFGVYVVNLFDTSRAAKLLKFAHLSLAFLMKHYCNVDPDKSYQLADWRERPLPLPMLQYARSDTHYLLYIYDRLRNDLLMKDPHDPSVGVELLRTVYRVGKEICLKRYEKPPFSEKSHLSILRKSRSTFNVKQMYAFKEMYAWRDAISRQLDESVGYVLPNNLMLRIAAYLPRDPQSITALCNPVPPTLKKHLADVHNIILKAKDIPLDEASKVMSDNPMNVNPLLRSIDLDTVSHKQDIAHSAGVHENSVPNLLDRLYQLNCSTDNVNGPSDERCHNSQSGRNTYRTNDQQTSRLYNFLDSSYNRRDEVLRSNVYETIQRQFVSPYHRYEATQK